MRKSCYLCHFSIFQDYRSHWKSWVFTCFELEEIHSSLQRNQAAHINDWPWQRRNCAPRLHRFHLHGKVAIQQIRRNITMASYNWSVLFRLQPEARASASCEAEECCICMDHKAETILPCSHSYCEECINNWLVPLPQKIPFVMSISCFGFANILVGT